jgi:nucleotide-binding universal stress UspA family protein/RimJ/RimL family protein N-acetyltransferase
VTLRDGARVGLRPIAPEDKPLLAASFARLSEHSRYRRFFTAKPELSAAELDYLVDVDHRDHEAIVAVDLASGDVLGVARYIRSACDPEVAEVAVTVVDDWHGRGLGRALADRLTYRARREGVRRFSAVIQSDNEASLALLKGAGDTRRRVDSGEVELVIELPPKRGTGARLGRALRAAAAGGLVPAKTLVSSLMPSSRPPVPPPRPIRTIVAGVDGSETATTALDAALELAALPGAALHLVSAYSALQEAAAADSLLAKATGAAGAAGVAAVTHRRSGDAAEALLAVAEEEAADLLVVGSSGRTGASRILPGNVADRVSHTAPCHVLIVRTR